MEQGAMHQVLNVIKVTLLNLLVSIPLYSQISLQMKNGKDVRTGLRETHVHRTGIFEGQFMVNYEGSVDSVIVSSSLSSKLIDLHKQKVLKMKFIPNNTEYWVQYLLVVSFQDDTNETISQQNYETQLLEAFLQENFFTKSGFKVIGNKVIIEPVFTFGIR
jgi:hypothetical protein